MKKSINRFAKWLLKKTSNAFEKELKQKIEEQTKGEQINKYFVEAYQKGHIKEKALFEFADGTKVFQIDIAQANFEMLLAATQEIPQQYAEYGMNRDKMYKFFELEIDQLAEAKQMIRIDPIACQDMITDVQNMIRSLTQDFVFGSNLRMNLEIFACYLVTQKQNPYIYDLEEKENLIARILQEKERLLPFLYAQPLNNLLNTSLDLQEDLLIASEVRATMKPFQEMKLNSLTIFDILALKRSGKKSPWISTELEIQTALSGLNTDI